MRYPDNPIYNSKNANSGALSALFQEFRSLDPEVRGGVIATHPNGFLGPQIERKAVLPGLFVGTSVSASANKEESQINTRREIAVNCMFFPASMITTYLSNTNFQVTPTRSYKEAWSRVSSLVTIFEAFPDP